MPATKRKTRRTRGLSSQPAAPYNERLPRHSITDFVGVSDDTAKEWITLAQAIRDIVTSDVTPSRLYNDVMGFLNDHSSDLWNDLMKSPEIIVKILVIAASKDAEPEGSAADGSTDVS